MLLATFNLSVVPFTKDISTTDLFHHPLFDEMLQRLRFLFDNRGIGLFTGEVGCGKSTCVRTACEALSSQTHKVVYIHRGLDNVGALYTQLALQLGLIPKYRRGDVAMQALTAMTELFLQQKVNTVIIVDEAHLLKPDILDEIRLIHNSRFDSADCLATALVGQSPLKKIVDLNRFTPLKQRLCVSAHLVALTREQSYQYFEHQLALAKTTVKIFLDNAVETIITAAKGIPRIINTVALKSMNDAADKKMTIVDQECVLRVLDELGLK